MEQAERSGLSAWAPWAAWLVPLACYVSTASAHGYWLDSNEFAAAAIGLDIAHPPGHPLSSLWGKAFTFLPLGSLPFRVALGQAFAGAFALAFIFRAIERSLSLTGLTEERARALLALAATWLLGASYGFWFNAVRPEVYALQMLCVSVALERLVALDARDPRPFYTATCALGLGLANHHLIALLALPSLGYALVMLLRAHGPRILAWGAASGALGLIAYAYLPLRAATDLAMNLGHPVTLENFVWVVSAKVYARRIGAEAIQPMGERFADLVVILVEDFGVPTLLLAVLGLYLLLRRRTTWPLAYAWGVTAFVSLCGRAWLNPVRNNPDVLGYMLPGFAALVALAACAVSVVLGALEPKGRSRAVIATLGAAAAALALLKGSHGLARASLADFHATDDLADVSRRALPARALVISTTPEMVFQHWGGEASEQLRPDVDMVPVPFLGYGDKAALIERAHPELGALLAAYEQSHLLSRPALQALARERPVLVEADTRVSLPVFEVLLPEGLLYRVLERAPSRVEITGAALVREGTYGALYAALGAQKDEAETRAKLLWMHYIDALYYTYHGVNDAARVAVGRGLALEPEARELRSLSHALDAAGGRALDIRAFLVWD